MGKGVSEEAYEWWVDKFTVLYEDPVFIREREAKGLFAFNLAGDELQDYMRAQVSSYRDLALEIGLIRQK